MPGELCTIKMQECSLFFVVFNITFFAGRQQAAEQFKGAEICRQENHFKIPVSCSVCSVVEKWSVWRLKPWNILQKACQLPLIELSYLKTVAGLGKTHKLCMSVICIDWANCTYFTGGNTLEEVEAWFGESYECCLPQCTEFNWTFNQWKCSLFFFKIGFWWIVLCHCFTWLYFGVCFLGELWKWWREMSTWGTQAHCAAATSPMT